MTGRLEKMFIHTNSKEKQRRREEGLVNCKKKRPVKNSCLSIVGLLQNRSES